MYSQPQKSYEINQLTYEYFLPHVEFIFVVA